MGNCCTSNKPNELPDNNEVDIASLNHNINNYNIYNNKIEKIQSYYRGMKTRKKFKKIKSNSFYKESKETNLNFA